MIFHRTVWKGLSSVVSNMAAALGNIQSPFAAPTGKKAQRAPKEQISTRNASSDKPQSWRKELGYKDSFDEEDDHELSDPTSNEFGIMIEEAEPRHVTLFDEDIDDVKDVQLIEDELN